MRAVPGQLAARLYAAADRIADRGLDNTKIDDIADATGIPKATLYYYFTGKEEILGFLLNDMLATIAGEVASAVEAPGSARQRLANAVTAQLRVMAQQPAVCRALVGDLGRATRLPALAAALQDAFHSPIEQLLREGAADGSLRPGPDPATTAMTIFGAITMAGLYYSVAPPDAPVGELANRIITVLMTGVAAHDAP